MINSYITKRTSPKGYVAVTRGLAEELFKRGFCVILCGSNVNHFNVLYGSHHGHKISKSTSTKPFALEVYDYMEAIPHSMGKHCVFYALQSQAEEVYQIAKPLSEIKPKKKKDEV